MKFRSLIIFLVLTIFIIMGLSGTSYAETEEVTDEKLKESFKKFNSLLKEDDEDYELTVENNQIKMTIDGKTYTINYDLTNKPTFTYEAEISQGMSYDEYNSESEGWILTELGYIIVADIKGIEYEKALSYFELNMLDTVMYDALNDDSADSYKIVDDENENNENSINENTNSKTIYASEFGDHVMEYVNSIYEEKYTFNDEDKLNSFNMTIEKKNETSTSCNLLTTLTVNTEADFSGISEYIDEKNVGNIIGNIISIEFNDNNLVNNNQTANISTMPKTGEENNPILNIIYPIMIISIIGICCLIITKKRT